MNWPKVAGYPRVPGLYWHRWLRGNPAGTHWRPALIYPVSGSVDALAAFWPGSERETVLLASPEYGDPAACEWRGPVEPPPDPDTPLDWRRLIDQMRDKANILKDSAPASMQWVVEELHGFATDIEKESRRAGLR